MRHVGEPIVTEQKHASSDSEFDALWEQMVADCNGLDANSIIEWRLADLENAKTIRDSL